MQGKAATACSFGSVAGAVGDQDLLRCAVCGPRFKFPKIGTKNKTFHSNVGNGTFKEHSSETEDSW
jgi:hypothetical protein